MRPRLSSALATLAAAFVLSTTHAPVAAQGSRAIVVLLPSVSGDATISEEMREEGRSSLLAALEAQGFVVHLVDESFPPELRGCAEGPCIDEVRRRAGADFVAVLTLWAKSDSSEPRQAVVSLIDGLSQEYYGRVNIEGSLGEAIREATEIAHSHVNVGPGPFLFVDGTPEGAEVHVDGELVGAIPYRTRVEPGTYDIEVRAEGHRPARRTETVPADVTWTSRLHIDLEPLGGPAAAGGADTWPNWLLAGGLLAGSVGLAISPIWTLATEGDCTTAAAFGCRERVRFGATSGVLLGLSGALLIGATVVAITQPLTISASVSPESARIQIQGAF